MFRIILLGIELKEIESVYCVEGKKRLRSLHKVDNDISKYVRLTAAHHNPEMNKIHFHLSLNLNKSIKF